MKLYRTFEAAQARVEQLKRWYGAWPGIIRHTGPLEGAWSLLWDPQDSEPGQ